jgi:hypothetical protein
MTKTKSKFRSAVLVIALVCATSFAYAQGGPGGPGDPGGDPDPGAAVPFDGGLSLVVAAGLAYAAKKGRDKRKKQTQQEQQATEK